MGSPISKTSTQSLSAILSSTGTHKVKLKSYAAGQLLAVSLFTLGVGEFPGAMLKASMLNPDIGQEVSFQTQTFELKPQKISYVLRDF